MFSFSDRSRLPRRRSEMWSTANAAARVTHLDAGAASMACRYFAITIVLISALYLVLSKRYKAAEQRWAFSDRDHLGVLAESAVGSTNSNFLAAAILGSSRTPARVALRQRRHHQPACSNVSAMRVAA